MAEGQATPEIPQETAPQEKPKETAGFHFDKIPGAFSKALEEAKKSGSKHWYEKIGIFAMTFWNEIRGIEKEKKEVSATAKAEAAKTIKEKMQAANDDVALDEAVTGSDKDFYEEVLAMGVTAGKELPLEMQDALMSGKDKLETAVKKGTPEESTLDEVKALGATGLLTLTKLKEKYPDQTKFEEALTRLGTISESSAYPLGTLLTMQVLKVFKTNVFKAAPLMKDFNIGMGEAFILKGISAKPLENVDKMANILKQHVFPNTDTAKVKDVIQIANKLIVEQADHLDPHILAELAFKIDTRDFKRLVEILSGKTATELAKAA